MELVMVNYPKFFNQGSDPLRWDCHGKAVGIIGVLVMVFLNGIVGRTISPLPGHM